MASAAAYELIEWWSTYLVAPEVGQAFLGSQGDPWDTQWDTFLALVGATVGHLFFGRLHDWSMEKLVES
jgi:putative membrane protein